MGRTVGRREVDGRDHEVVLLARRVCPKDAFVDLVVLALHPRHIWQPLRLGLRVEVGTGKVAALVLRHTLVRACALTNTRTPHIHTSSI